MMSEPSIPNIASLVTVTSRDYLPGTRVMLHSFLAAHEWFDGEIVLLADDLTDQDKAGLSATFKRISFKGPSPELHSAVSELVASVPKLRGRARRFYSLDAFGPDRSGDVLFCDGDLLFRSAIDAMLKVDGPLIACGDRAQVAGSGRDPHSLAELNGVKLTGAELTGAELTGQAGSTGFATFNAGLMVIKEELRTSENWAAMLAQLNPQSWQEIASQHTDQAVFNRLFGGQVVLADISYNYLVGHGTALRNATGASMTDAKVLHFNGPAKPWNFDRHLAAAGSDAGFIRAAQEWFTAYTDFLTAHHFASR